MVKCVLCPSRISPEEESVLFYLKPESDSRKSRAHLRCYVEKYFIITKGRPCFPSDFVLIMGGELCYWCRQPGVVATMGRSGQAICASCNDKLVEMFQQSDQVNLPAVAKLTGQ